MFKWLFTLARAEEGLAVAEAAVQNTYKDLPIFQKGLVVTGLGLVGVFLVLFLFYLAIKAMQRIKPKEDKPQ